MTSNIFRKLFVMFPRWNKPLRENLPGADDDYRSPSKRKKCNSEPANPELFGLVWEAEMVVRTAFENGYFAGRGEPDLVWKKWSYRPITSGWYFVNHDGGLESVGVVFVECTAEDAFIGGKKWGNCVGTWWAGPITMPKFSKVEE